MKRQTKTRVLSALLGLGALAGLFSAPVAGVIEALSKAAAVIIQTQPTDDNDKFEVEKGVRE